MTGDLRDEISNGNVQDEDFVEVAEEEIYKDINEMEEYESSVEEYKKWVNLRRETVKKLKDIADYMEKVTRKTTIAKIAGAGSSIVASVLTIVGGILTIASAGAALPISITGTCIGITAGFGGGAAAITEKIINSKQLKEAKKAVDADSYATFHLEARIEDGRHQKEIAKQAVISGGSTAKGLFDIVRLASRRGKEIRAGLKATAQHFGDDVGKEVSKAASSTSRKVISGALTIVFSGAAMIYDIYTLNAEIKNLASSGNSACVRKIAEELEVELNELAVELN